MGSVGYGSGDGDGSGSGYGDGLIEAEKKAGEE